MRDAVLAHARHDAIEIGTQLGKIEVAVGIDEHVVILRLRLLYGCAETQMPTLEHKKAAKQAAFGQDGVTQMAADKTLSVRSIGERWFILRCLAAVTHK